MILPKRSSTFAVYENTVSTEIRGYCIKEIDFTLIYHVNLCMHLISGI